MLMEWDRRIGHICIRPDVMEWNDRLMISMDDDGLNLAQYHCLKKIRIRETKIHWYNDPLGLAYLTRRANGDISPR